jgi:murein DD-endopeptidase MepM/ murein hydrolase activator NlpD
MVVAVAIALGGAVAAYRARPPVTAEKTRQVRIAGAAVTKAGADSRTLVVPGADDLVPSLLATGIAPDQAAEAARLVRRGLGGEGELRLVLAIDRAGPVRLGALTATRADGSGVALTASAAGFDATRLDAKLVRSVDFVRGELDGQSFYSSAVAAGVADVLVGEFANVFRYDFDMQREVHPGDVFEAGFEQRRNAAGEPVGAPVLVYAALSTAAKSRALYRFQPDQGEAEWVDSGGRSNRRSLMRTPVEAARISSGFGPRGHPILGFVKMHRGTDFAAPTGTPIFAAGDAVVTVAGFRGANGNFVRLRHDNGWETLYLHMNRIADGIAPGARIGQGQQIGEVGTTGRSTGPHLHYEVHVAGQAVDPLSIETGGGRTLAGAVLKAFRGLRDRIDARRAATG